ncbi:MAG: PTS sugar transporter subunit IIB [Hungatella sp.]|jgi:PTS system cellobiose-specific IIB component|nr:PTS sugar transporter subunit IIB [Hungatella sp.]
MKILLCCGAGMSSGFLANNVKKAAKKRMLNISVEAKSHVDAANHLTDADVLLLGPHYSTEKEKFEKVAEQYHLTVAVIPGDIYGMLDGDALLEYALSIIKGEIG